MKTTVEIPDELLRQVRDLARAEGTSMRELMIEGLRSELDRRQTAQPRVDFVFTTAGGDGLQAGVEAEQMINASYGLAPQ